MTPSKGQVKIQTTRHLPPELQRLRESVVSSFVGFLQSAEEFKKELEKFVDACAKHGISQDEARDIIEADLRAHGLRDRRIRALLPDSVKNKNMVRKKKSDLAAKVSRKLEQFRKKMISLEREAYAILDYIKDSGVDIESFFTKAEYSELIRHELDLQGIIEGIGEERSTEEDRRRIRFLSSHILTMKNSSMELVILLSENASQRKNRIQSYESTNPLDFWSRQGPILSYKELVLEEGNGDRTTSH